VTEPGSRGAAVMRAHLAQKPVNALDLAERSLVAAGRPLGPGDQGKGRVPGRGLPLLWPAWRPG
jgi:hypothetical protein